MFKLLVRKGFPEMIFSCLSIQKNSPAIATIFTVLLTLLFGGCGYHLQGSGTILPEDIHSVAIQPVENDTTETGVSLTFEEALRSRFERYGTLKVVDDSDKADAVLSARVTKLQTRTRSVTGNTDLALEVDLIMTVSAELKRRNGQLLWRDNSLDVTQPFASTGGVVVTTSSSFAQSGIGGQTLGSLDSLQVSRGQKDQAISDLIDEATRQIYLDAVAADF